MFRAAFLLLLVIPAAALSVNRHDVSKIESDEEGPSKGKYGFYIHAFGQAKAVITQLRDVRRIYPDAPVYIMSDGGMDFKGICEEIGNCEFRWKPGANDRWNPKPFLFRFKEAAKWLNTEYVVMLEPDVQLHGPITHEPTEDAGGLMDSNPALHQATIDYIESLAHKVNGKDKYKVKWNHFGLAGGMYVRTKAVKDAFDADLLDWEKIAKLEGHRAFSSDVAMCLVLAAKGYTYYPWDDLRQERFDEFYKLDKKRTTAFQHHGKDEGSKPNYDAALSEDEKKLVTPHPKGTSTEKDVSCQGCVWVNSDAECGEHSCPIVTPPGKGPVEKFFFKVVNSVHGDFGVA